MAGGRGLEPRGDLSGPALLEAQRERVEDVRPFRIILLQLAADPAGRAHELLGFAPRIDHEPAGRAEHAHPVEVGGRTVPVRELRERVQLPIEFVEPPEANEVDQVRPERASGERVEPRGLADREELPGQREAFLRREGVVGQPAVVGEQARRPDLGVLRLAGQRQGPHRVRLVARFLVVATGTRAAQQPGEASTIGADVLERLVDERALDRLEVVDGDVPGSRADGGIREERAVVDRTRVVGRRHVGGPGLVALAGLVQRAAELEQGGGQLPVGPTGLRPELGRPPVPADRVRVGEARRTLRVRPRAPKWRRRPRHRAGAPRQSDGRTPRTARPRARRRAGASRRRGGGAGPAG